MSSSVIERWRAASGRILSQRRHDATDERARPEAAAAAAAAHELAVRAADVVGAAAAAAAAPAAAARASDATWSSDAPPRSPTALALEVSWGRLGLSVRSSD